MSFQRIVLACLLTICVLPRGVRSVCSYPGSKAIADGTYTFDAAECALDYTEYASVPTPQEALIQAYAVRCPQTVTASTKVYTFGGLSIRGDIQFYDQYRDTFETCAAELAYNPIANAVFS